MVAVRVPQNARYDVPRFSGSKNRIFGGSHFMVWLQCENAGVIFQKGLLFYGLRGGDASFFLALTWSQNFLSEFVNRVLETKLFFV